MKKISALVIAVLLSISAFAQWDSLQTGTNYNFNGIAFSDANNGVIVGVNPINSREEIRITSDGGANWETPLLSVFWSNAPAFNDVFVSGTYGWVVGDSGYVIQTTDMGITWNSSTRTTKKNLFAVSFANNHDGYVAGENGVLYRTINAGTTWDTLYSGTNLSIRDMFFTDAANGWIVGDGGYLAATSDSGNTWTQIAQPFFGFMNIQGFAYNASYSNAIIVGNNGDALFSSNSGMNWNSFLSGVNTTLNKVAFANNLGGVIVGNNGVILRTEDGGTTWTRDAVQGVTQNLTGISWASDTLAYICGSNGRILKSHYDISSVNSPLVNSMIISVFPNPFAEELNIVVDLQKNSSVRISVMDLTGRIVLEENEGELNSGKQLIHTAGISSLVSGMYFVKVISGNGEMVIPVVKK